jgi:hypothetical protein
MEFSSGTSELEGKSPIESKTWTHVRGPAATSAKAMRLITYQFQGEAIKRPVGAGFSPRKSRAKARSYGHMWQTDRWRAHHPKKKQLDRNLQDKQDDAIYRKCEFIRTQRPE